MTTIIVVFALWLIALTLIVSLCKAAARGGDWREDEAQMEYLQKFHRETDN